MEHRDIWAANIIYNDILIFNDIYDGSEAEPTWIIFKNAKTARVNTVKSDMPG